MPAPSNQSFIPKQPASAQLRKRSVRRIYILSYISFVVFFGVVIAAAGTFFYKVNVGTELENSEQTLVQLRSEFQSADFERVKFLATQLDEASQLLDRHVSLVAILKALEDSTVATVAYSSLDYTRTLPTELTLDVAGVTDNFNSLIFQRQVYGLDPSAVLSGAKIANFTSTYASELETSEVQTLVGDEEQIVEFTLVQSIGPSNALYEPSSEPIEAEPVTTEPEFDEPITTSNEVVN